MAIQVVTTTTAVHIEEPLPPSMLTKTVSIVRKLDGSKAVINSVDWNVPDGEYTDADYTLDTDVKKAVAPAPSDQVTPVSTPWTAPDLQKKGSKELTLIATGMGIEVHGGMDKPAIIAEIIAKQGT